MAIIVLKHLVDAPIQTVFDAHRSVDEHLNSAKNTQEKVVDGITSGLLNLNDTVTWRAKHFGVHQNLSIEITAMEAPHSFVDEMTSGIFKRFRHEHRFEEIEEEVLVTDRFDYTAPLGVLGKIADILFLRSYMTRFLESRNHYLKHILEENSR